MSVYYRAVDFGSKRTLFLGKVYDFHDWLVENQSILRDSRGAFLVDASIVDAFQTVFGTQDKRINGLRLWLRRSDCSDVVWVASEHATEVYESGWQDFTWQDEDVEDYWRNNHVP